ncbi:hypothetical protein [Myroides injenensis]|uniref:hypothetical protein n=1 Tax=Myroides injenensis TaxID=1183151 RepID=UPI00028851C0|nr:hypothetical protein [Myroides injenensis]
MKPALIFNLFFLLFSSYLFAQSVSYVPEVMAGHRSYFYTHTIQYQINQRLKLQNLTLFDSEYKEDNHNIFFIRNTLAYQLNKSFVANIGFGVKNPGKFFTTSLQYQIVKKDFVFMYGIGATYQAGWTLEQSLLLEYTPRLTKDYQALFRISAVGNMDKHEYTRGFQHIRLGLKNANIAYGIGVNLEQFNNSWHHLENVGAFFKVNFK